MNVAVERQIRHHKKDTGFLPVPDVPAIMYRINGLFRFPIILLLFVESLLVKRIGGNKQRNNGIWLRVKEKAPKGFYLYPLASI